MANSAKTRPRGNMGQNKEDIVMIFDKLKGYAYQKDRSKPIEYGNDYFDKLKKYEGADRSDRAQKISGGRVRMVKRYEEYWSSFAHENILDYGCGACTFIKTILDDDYFHIFPRGWDVMTESKRNMPQGSRWFDPYNENMREIGLITMWDVIEHLPEPSKLLDLVKHGTCVILSTPLYDSLDDIKDSKHYRPNEHFWYFTDKGIKVFMAEHGFFFEEQQYFEMAAGRENIGTYVFVK